MSYAVLSLPNVKNLKSDLYTEDHASSLKVRAQSYAEANGLVRSKDFEIWQPMTAAQLDEPLNDIRQRNVVYIDAHGKQYYDAAGHELSKIDIPASSSDRRKRQWVHPADLKLRDSSIELVVLGACFQRSASWEYAVPPGCVVIGYRHELMDTYYPYLYERFADLGQLLRYSRAPEPHEYQAWLEHIKYWLDRNVPENSDAMESCHWFITAGKH